MNFSTSLLNLASFINMSAYHLRKVEVVYELKIRNLSTEGTAGDLRKRLSQGLSANTKIDEAIVNSLVPESELEECEGKFQDLSALVADYEGNYNDNEFSRIMARLWHLYNRVSRIPVGAAAPDVEEGKDTLMEKSKELLDVFEEAKANPTKPSKDEESADVDPTLLRPLSIDQSLGLPLPSELTAHAEGNTGHLGDWNLGKDGRFKEVQFLQDEIKTPEHRKTEDERRCKEEIRRLQEERKLNERRLREERRKQEELWKQRDRKLQEELEELEARRLAMNKTSSTVYGRRAEESPREDWRSRTQPHHVPVYKWGLQFDGQSQSVGAFLQRVEEIRRARGVSHDELFDSAVDLFSGSALVWYRSTIGRINTWTSLCRELKIVFQTPDHDIRLQQEIFSRVQGDSEPIDLFIAAMEGLYGRLATIVPEDVRLTQIFHNLNPQLQDRLALFDVTSIEQLRLFGRKAEAGRFRSTVPRGSMRSVGALEPDLALAYEPSRRRTNQIASVQTPLPKKEIRAVCWNCSEVGHRHNTCQKPKKKFCFGCGTPDVIKSNCPKCTKRSNCANCSKNE